MAYDQNSTYEPPGRAYYGQAQQAPVQYGYTEYTQEPYDGQGYGNGQAQDYGHAHQQYERHNRPNGHSANTARQENYSDGYYRGHGQEQAQDQSRTRMRPQEQQQGRAYDPRYQVRPGKPNAATHGYSQQQSLPPQQQTRPDYRQSPVNVQQGHQAPASNLYRTTDPGAVIHQEHGQWQQDSRNGHPPQRQHLPQQTSGMTPPPRPPGNNSVSSFETKKTTMEEWKAKERARMHSEALSPEVLAQDNAFPVFPTKAVKEYRQRADDRSGSVMAMSHASNDDHSPPSSSSSHIPNAHEQRPSVFRNNNFNHQSPPYQDALPTPQTRPSLDHQPFSSEPRQQRQAEHRLPPPHQQSQPRPLREQPQSSQHRPPPQQRPSTAGGRSQVRPIDTSQIRQPAYMDHQPLSPAFVPPRPSSAQGGRLQPKSPPVQSPLSQYSSSQRPADDDFNKASQMLPPVRTEEHPQLTQNDTLGDLYDDYSERNVQFQPLGSKPAPKTREEEIEAEMPDFDSAAPQQTSNLHKRKQTVDRHLGDLPVATPPPMPAIPPQSARQAMFPPKNVTPSPYQQQPDPYTEMGQRKQRHASPPEAGGFDFGLQQQEPSQQYQYDQGFRPPPQQLPHDIAYRQGATSVQAPNPPFANEQLSRHSMDDARQMPYRQEPPQRQRFHRNGQPVAGPYPPHQRPEMDRNMSAQTTWSDPGAQRGGSAPPGRQGFPEPPGRAPSGRSASLNQQYPPEQQRLGNPDALPQHPAPVRPGLMEVGGQQSARPPPIRNYETASVASSRSSHARKVSVETQKPVTFAELDALRADCAANPGSYSKSLLLAKKLVEAASVLASEGGRVDARTAAKNREKYILDAHKRVKKLVTAGYPDAQFYLADCYGQGLLGLEPDMKEAFNLYQAAAKQNHAQAAYRTAVCCEIGPEEGGGTRKDLAKALQWYRRAAALGETAAMFKVGIVALKGLLGQPRNVGEAITWLKRAADMADGANPHALHELATLYESANTDREVRNKVIADDKYACELFQKAAGLGLKQSQFRLGQAYEYGHMDLSIDNRQSIAWYSKAAAQGEHQAELALSGWYLTGAEGILEHNDTEAYLWARKAASSEPPLPKAMFAMGYFSEQGIGCPASIEEARRWYGRAASKLTILLGKEYRKCVLMKRTAHKFPKALERLEELKKSGKSKPAPANGKLTRKDQKRDEENCVIM